MCGNMICAKAATVQEKALRDVDPAVRRRVFHLIKHPAQLATLQQARKAVAEGGSDVLDASGTNTRSVTSTPDSATRSPNSKLNCYFVLKTKMLALRVSFTWGIYLCFSGSAIQVSQNDIAGHQVARVHGIYYVHAWHAGARRDHEDQFTVLQPSVALSSSQQFKKDRRKGNVKDLDKYALAVCFSTYM